MKSKTQSVVAKAVTRWLNIPVCLGIKVFRDVGGLFLFSKCWILSFLTFSAFLLEGYLKMKFWVVVNLQVTCTGIYTWQFRLIMWPAVQFPKSRLLLLAVLCTFRH
jgi:hypothetical protein